MKNLFFIDDTLTNKISYYHILLFLVFLPFDRFYTELILISFLLHTLIHLRKPGESRLKRKEVIIAQSVFLLTVAGILYSTNTGQAISLAGRQLAILLFPVIIWLNPFDLTRYRINFLRIFALTCTLLIVYLYADALFVIRYYHLPASSLFSPLFMNHNFSAPVGLHATYLSLYLGVSLTYLITELYTQAARARTAVLVAVVILSAGLLQLGSRAVLIGELLVLGMAFPFVFLKGKRKSGFIYGFSLFLLLLGFIISRSESFRQRYFSELKYDLVENSTPHIIENPRIQRWEVAWDLIKKSPVRGYGSGDEVDVLKQKYFENKLYNSFLFGLNAHNEYLSFLITAGILGLLVYVSTLFYGFRMALRAKDTVFLGFLILITIVSFSENYLDVNKGIFFYAFFFTFFLRTAERKTSQAGP